MRKIVLSTLSLSLLLSTLAAAGEKPRYSDRMFRKALDDDSTSPLYLLFILHDDKTGIDRTVCTPGAGLLGAIHMEHHLDYDDASRELARKIALSQTRHRFSFRNRRAFQNVQPYYSERVLDGVRHLLAAKSNADLIRAGTLYATNPHYTLGEIYDKRTRSEYNAYHNATAHVMLERGILVGSDDRTNLIYVAR